MGIAIPNPIAAPPSTAAPGRQDSPICTAPKIISGTHATNSITPRINSGTPYCPPPMFFSS